jgi:cytochrome c-type biogenesis protein CcmF
MADLGRAALVTAFLLLVYASVLGTYAAWHSRRRLAQSAQNALVAAFVATGVGVTVLLTALARHDFSFAYVAQHTSRELPLGYTLTAFWGGQEGSLLLWLFVLCGYSVAAVLTARRAGREVLAWVVPTLGVVGTFFAFMLVFVASPFST